MSDALAVANLVLHGFEFERGRDPWPVRWKLLALAVGHCLDAGHAGAGDAGARGVRGANMDNKNTAGADFIVTDEGPLWMFEPISDAAREKVTEFDLDSWQWIGHRFSVEHSQARDIVEALRAKGFKFDFNVAQ